VGNSAYKSLNDEVIQNSKLERVCKEMAVAQFKHFPEQTEKNPQKTTVA
jgi:hypothetical protein